MKNNSTKTISPNNVNEWIDAELPETDWFQITQQQINQFADCTLDHQFIHVDEQKAKQTPFGSTIAHGFLTMSMLSHFAEQFSVLMDGFYMGINAGFNNVRFLHPVHVNSFIRAKAKILAIEQKSSTSYRFITQVTIEIKDCEIPALVADWISIQMIK